MTFSVISLLVDNAARVRFAREQGLSGAIEYSAEGVLLRFELGADPAAPKPATQDSKRAAKPPNYREVILASGSQLRPRLLERT